MVNDFGFRGGPLLAVIGNVEAFTRDGQTIVRGETIESWGTQGFRLERQVGDEWVRILFYGPYELTVDGPGRTYADWAAEQFTGEELDDPAIDGENADPDGDGLTHWQEFLAWTDPKSADSVLKVTWLRQVEGGLELQWQSVPGRSTRIALSESMSRPFLPLEEAVVATDETTVVVLPAAAKCTSK